jgi:hypothetical protein
MMELHPVVGQHLAYEQPAVALLRLTLAAQQGDPMLPTAAQQALHGRPKRWLFCHAVIARATLLVVMLLP